MFELSTTAERLRIARQAYHDFLTLWAVEQALDDPRITDRICGDLEEAESDPFGRSGRRLNMPGPNADNKGDC
jgi:hypothetical protein